jgi:hypothetical protein
MGQCSSCGLDLPGTAQMCRQCHHANCATLTAPGGRSNYSWSTCIDLLLRIFVSYAFLTYMPGLAKVVVLGVALLVVLCLDFWAFSQRPWRRYGTLPPEQISFVLALCCGAVWKITGADVWFRLGAASMLVCAGYRIVYRATALSKAARS